VATKLVDSKLTLLEQTNWYNHDCIEKPSIQLVRIPMLHLPCRMIATNALSGSV